MKNLIIFTIFVMGLVGSNYPMKAEAITAAHSFLSHSLNNRIMNNQKEIWKDIKCYEGRYQISNIGRVKSFCSKKVKYRKLQVDKFGYNVLSFKNPDKTYFIHRLVALHFICNIKNKPQINHINGIKTDNRFENLEWCTNYENMQHAFKIGLKKASFKGKKIYQYSLDNKYISEYDSVIKASVITGINKNSISKCARGESKKSNGYIWRYYE